MDAVIVLLIESIVTILLDPVVLVGALVLIVALGSGLAARLYEAVDVRLPRQAPSGSRRPVAAHERH